MTSNMDVLTPKSPVPANKTDAEFPSTDDHIEWFRQASPYINAHRGKTFVLCFSGSALASEQFPTLVHDITLLKNLGVRLVLVHGLRPQIDRVLSLQGVASSFNKGLRITDDFQLDAVISEVGRARIQIESHLSMGMANTPMSGAHISVASGNFVTAQPYGVIDGIDHCHTGIVRQIHTNAIRRQVDNDQLVLLSPIGYSRTGELFNLEATDVATHAAISLKAEKLIFISDQRIEGPDSQPIMESTPSALAQLTDAYAAEHPARLIASKAILACRAGVKRVHILDEADANSLLKELYTRDGSGTMINSDNYEILRKASILDVGGIIELIKPLEQEGILVKRSREQLELDIEKFCVIERDGLVITCAALLPDTQTDTPTDTEGNRQTNEYNTAEIACLATHPDYRNSGRAEALLAHLEQRAQNLSLHSVYVLTTRSDHWFIEHGFHNATTNELPQGRRDALNTERNSKILMKKLN